jgi:hypothetical protein
LCWLTCQNGTPIYSIRNVEFHPYQGVQNSTEEPMAKLFWRFAGDKNLINLTALALA